MGSPHIEKKCGDCQKRKPVEEFYRDQSTQAKLKRDCYCKSCRRKRDAKRSANYCAQKKKTDPLFYRRKKLMSMYGITNEQYMKIHKKQRGLCAMCHKPEKRKLYGGISNLAVDHNHTTGKIRALLCCRCNAGLGLIEDKDFMKIAQAYLEKHE